jgi:hypothetical protein
MDNKKVKQMICDIADSKDECVIYPFGHFFHKDGFAVSFFSGWGSDNYFDDYELIGYGEVSLTASQLKGIKPCQQ